LLQFDLIAVDAGNTRVKIGGFRNQQLQEVAYWTPGEPLPNFYGDIGHIVSVSWKEEELMEQLARLANGWRMIEPHDPFLFPSDYALKEMGMDRKMMIHAAQSTSDFQSILVVSLGTCMTMDWIDQHGIHRGGRIAPGWFMRLDGMHRLTKRLPLLEGEEAPLLGTCTQEAMQSGAFQGILAEIHQLFQEIQQKDPQVRLWCTGGDADIFVPLIQHPVEHRPHLVLHGLAHYRS